MKKTIILILFSFWRYAAFAQDCAKEGTPTSTDWTKYNSTDRNYPNNWNWTIPGVVHPVYLTNNLSNPSFSIQLPYFCGLPAGSGSCGNQNTLQYEILENKNLKQDVYPEDGWELLVKNFGTPTIGTNSGRGVPNPYFVLYNRFNGKMKIYYAIVGSRAQNSGYLEVFIDYKSTKRAVFAHVEPVAQALQDFHPSNRFKVLNDFAQMTSPTDYYWLVGEIQTAYDPCSCTEPTLPTQPIIIVRPYLVTVTTIEAKIEGQLTQKLASGGQVQGETTGKTSFIDVAKNAANAGLKSYNQFEGYRKQVADFLDKRNGAYKEKLTRAWWDKEGAGEKYPLTQINEKFQAFMKYDDNAKLLWGIANIDKYNKTFGLIKQVAGAAPYVGAAIGVIDYFINGGQKVETKPAAPMVFDVNLKLSGELTTPLPQPQISFDLPGSTLSNNNSLNAYYNRTLGVFNIVKPPAMEFFELKATVVNLENRDLNRNDCELAGDKFGLGFQKAKTQSAKQFRLKEDVKYLLNPNAGLDIELIDACFVLEYKGNENLFLNNPLAFDTTAAIPLHSKIYGDADNGDGRGISFANRIKSIEESGYDLEYVSKDYPSGPNSFIRFRTKYMPLQCLKNMNFVLWGGKPPKIYLKMLVKTKRKDLATAEGVTNIVTYDISRSIAEATKNAKEGSISHNLRAFSEKEKICVFCCTKLNSKYITYDVFKYIPDMNFNTYPFLEGSYSTPYKDFIVNNLAESNPYYTYPATFSTDYFNSGVTSNVNVTGNITLYDNSVIASNVTLKTLGKIIVGKNVTFGNNVTLIAGQAINFEPGTQIPPVVTILIQPSNATDVFGCNNPNIKALHATADEIYGATNGICQSKRYQDSTKVAPFRDNDTTEVVSSLRVKKADADFKATLECIPNPFSNFFTINYDLNADESITVILSNSLGQTVKTLINEKINAGNYQLHVSTEGLPVGIYFVTLHSKFGNQTKKVVKINY